MALPCVGNDCRACVHGAGLGGSERVVQGQEGFALLRLLAVMSRRMTMR